MLNKLLFAAFGLASMLLLQGSASAAACVGSIDVTTVNKRTKVSTTVSTPYDLAGKLATATECYIAGAGNDRVGGTDSALWTVNSGAFFDINDWQLDGKFESGSTQRPALATLTWDAGAANLRGTFTLTEKALAYENIMFVFKSGANTSLVAYLLEPDSKGGAFSTPFVRLPFMLSGGSTEKAISHISVYYSGEAEEPIDLPEPATAALFGLGALGFVALRRKRVTKE